MIHMALNSLKAFCRIAASGDSFFVRTKNRQGANIRPHAAPATAIVVPHRRKLPAMFITPTAVDPLIY